MNKYLINFILLSISYGDTIEYFNYDSNRSIPNVDAFSLDYKNESLMCYPTKIIRKKSRKDLVSFVCIKKDIPIQYIPKEKQVSPTEQQGRDETKKLKLQIADKENIGVLYNVDIPLSDTSSLWLSRTIAKQQLNNRYYIKYLTWFLPAKFYISLRPQLSNSDDKRHLKLRDGGSRAGFFYYYRFDNDWDLTTQYEATINWDDLSSFINLSTQSNNSRRLSYISISHNDYTVLVGKYWSAYYDIAGLTDKFMTYGALASGAFNNKSDGSNSGTGRADYLLQLNVDKLNHDSTIQVQLRHKADSNIDTHYKYNIAASYLYHPRDDFQIGCAFNYGHFEQITPHMKSIGIDDNELSIIGGVSYSKDHYLINATFSYSKNHLNDENGIYFDGYGAEVYAHYDYSNQIRFAAGYNYLKPKSTTTYYTPYKISTTILSLQYTFNKRTFDDLVYVELSIPNGRLSDGQRKKTAISFGFHYLIDF
jgi:hypothetical protein